MNHPMHDMAEKALEDSLPASVAKNGEKVKYYPSQTISSEYVPEIENYDVGDDVDIHILGYIVSKEEREKDGKVTCDYRIESRKLGIMISGKAKRREEMGKEQASKYESSA